MSLLSSGSSMQDTVNISRKAASKMSVPTTPANPRYVAAPAGKFASAMVAGIAKTAVIISDQTGACQRSLTYENFSGIILSKLMAKNVLEATRRNGGMSLATQNTPAMAMIIESQPTPMPLATSEAIPVLHAPTKLGTTAAIAALSTPP